MVRRSRSDHASAADAIDDRSRPGRRRAHPRGALAVVAMAALIAGVSACSGGTAGSPSASAGATAAPIASVAPGASGACLDVAQLGDLGETVSGAMQTMSDDLKAGNVDGAKSAAATTASGLRSLADYVATAQPQAAQQLRDAADAVDKATTSFPAGIELVTKAKQGLDDGFKLARTAACPS